MQVFGIASGFCDGATNMALDEVLLEAVRSPQTSEMLLEAVQSPQTSDAWGGGPVPPILIVRTYCWQEPTLSLGANQAVRDINFLLNFYGQQTPVRQVVRRPTGGRAILHGEDISYSFITNDPAVLRLDLNGSYAIFAGLIQETLTQLDLPVRFSEEASGKAYARSPVCFETHTPSDLLGEGGEKLTGAAQLRRQGGILQHGAAFLKPYGISETEFTAALFAVVAQHYGAVADFPLSVMASQLAAMEASYRKESAGILASASTTSGSHLVPASF